MSNTTYYARFYCPFTNEGTPNTSDTGHVDLEIVGTNMDLLGDGRTSGIVNPVISYGRKSDDATNPNAGQFTIFPASAKTAAFTSSHLMCKLKFEVSAEFHNAVLTELQDSLVYRNEGSSTYPRYNVIPNHLLSTYSQNLCHCYFATGYLLLKAGITDLLNYYYQYTNESDPDDNGYLNYTCWKMFQRKCGLFQYSYIYKNI